MKRFFSLILFVSLITSYAWGQIIIRPPSFDYWWLFKPSISGKVAFLDAKKTPLENVTVYLWNKGIIVKQTKTNKSGYYSFWGVSKGTYKVTASYKGVYRGITMHDAYTLKNFSSQRNYWYVFSAGDIRFRAADVDRSKRVDQIDVSSVIGKFLDPDFSFGVNNDFQFSTGDVTLGDYGFGDYGFVDLGVLATGSLGDTSTYGPGWNVYFQHMGFENIYDYFFDIRFRFDRVLNGVCSMGIEITHDPGMKVRGITSSYLRGLSYREVAPGRTRVAWQGNTGVTIPNGSTLFTATFENIDATASNFGLNTSVTTFTNTMGARLGGNILAPELILSAGAGPMKNKPVENTETNNNFELKQNYPNPFTGTTTIEYIAPEEGIATIDVYNLSGQKIITINETVTTGNHLFAIDGSQLAKGNYIYKLNFAGKANNYTQSMMMSVK